MEKQIMYLNQSVQDNILETVLMVLVLAFLCYVIKLAFIEKDD
ncbi:MAG: hypothetical protein ACFNT6_09705 [Neisseria sp.]|nr:MULTISPECIES: hypothetical protein [Neisseria]